MSFVNDYEIKKSALQRDELCIIAQACNDARKSALDIRKLVERETLFFANDLSDGERVILLVIVEFYESSSMRSANN